MASVMKKHDKNIQIVKYLFNYLLKGLHNNKYTKKQISKFVNQIHATTYKTSYIYAISNQNEKIIQLFVDYKDKFSIDCNLF